MGGSVMEEQLYPEEQMQIEKVGLNAFLFAADFGVMGVEHLFEQLKGLAKRLYDYDNGKSDNTGK